jgi:phage gp29-like protein
MAATAFSLMQREQLPHQAAANRALYAEPPLSISEKETDFAEMRRDATIAGCLDALTQAVLARPWYVAPARRDDRAAVAVAADIEANLRDLPLETCLDNALEALVYGFTLHEITWRYVGKRFRLHRLGDLAPEQIAFDLDDHMNIVHIRSKPMGFLPKVVPRDKVWLFRHRASRQYPAGRSVLEAVHRAWNAKNHILRFWGTTLQRYGMPLLILTLPANADTQMQAEALDAAQRLQLDGVAILPSGVSYLKEDPPQWHGLSFEAAIHFQESQMVRRLLLALHSQGGTGQTYVTGDGLLMQARSTSYLLARLSRHLCESFTEEVIRPLVFANYGRRPDLVPQFMLPPPGETNLPDVAQPLAALVTAGILTRQQAAVFAGFEWEAEGTPPPASNS